MASSRDIYITFTSVYFQCFECTQGQSKFETHVGIFKFRCLEWVEKCVDFIKTKKRQTVIFMGFLVIKPRGLSRNVLKTTIVHY